MRNIIVYILFTLNFISLISMDKSEEKQLVIPKKQTSFLKITKPKKSVRKKNSPATMSTPSGIWKYLIQNVRNYLSDEEINPFVLTLYRANKRLHHHALLYYMPSSCDSDSDLMSDSESDTPIPSIEITPATNDRLQRSVEKNLSSLGIFNPMRIAIQCKSAVGIRLCLNDPKTEKSIPDLNDALEFAQQINDNSLIALLIKAGANNI